MDNEKLIQIKENLVALPILQKRIEQLELKKVEAGEQVKSLLNKYNSEAKDVEQMNKYSLSNTLLKLIDKYDGKLDKETQEMLTAKLKYDKAISNIDSIEAELLELRVRMKGLLHSKQLFETELYNREKLIKTSITKEAYTKYGKLEAEKEAAAAKIMELGEAIKAAQTVLSTAGNAMEHLSSAEGWATFDVWARGGLISHMAKYDHIDHAQENLNTLSYQLKKLEKELADVELTVIIEGVGIDPTTRAFDFWFDNIFTDLNVRDKIYKDQEKLNKLIEGIANVEKELTKRRMIIASRLEEVDNSIKELLISFKS